MALRFDGRVALVTGAGGGLGRTYALMFADRGASVVVNDLGGDMHGGGKSAAADKVVDEIRRFGGKAVANYDSVEEGEKIVKTAIDQFGKIDIVVNNAGILRDKSFLNMTENDWDQIFRVHVKGAFKVSKAVWPYMRKQKYGRIIMTSSSSGIYGNFGQANYSTAKLGLVALSNTLALEGKKYGIQSNAIVPTAGSRMTRSVMSEELLTAFKADYVTPLAGWLCHHSCTTSGSVFEAGAGFFGRLEFHRNKGKVLNGLATTLEDVRDNWTELLDMNGARHVGLANLAGQTQTLLESIAALKQKAAPMEYEQLNDRNVPSSFAPNKPLKNQLDVERMKATRFPPQNFTYTSKDAILYALGVGAQSDDLRFIYENHEQFSVLPSFAVVFSFPSALQKIDGFEPDYAKLLHGEQYIEVKRTFPHSGSVRSMARLSDVYDRGSGAVLLLDVETFDATTGEQLAFCQFTSFHRGRGNFGGPRTSAAEKKTVTVPNRPPDHVQEQHVPLDQVLFDCPHRYTVRYVDEQLLQAALYRLASGDWNPLHIDPQFARSGGHSRPILHGLCTLGYSVRHVLRRWAADDVARFRAVKGRFSAPVLMGQTLQTDMWSDGSSRIHFQTKVKESGKVVISGGYVDLAPANQIQKSAVPTATRPVSLKSDEIFEQMKAELQKQPQAVEKARGSFGYIITKDGKEAAKWTVDLRSGVGDIYRGEPNDGSRPQVTLTTDDESMVALVAGRLNPQQAFMSGKIKIKGNIMLLQKLQALMAKKPKL